MHCIYCGVDCSPPQEAFRDVPIDHAPDCPATTGRFPVTEKDFPGGIRCGCGKALLEGDFYASKPDGMVGQHPLSELCCLECAGVA